MHMRRSVKIVLGVVGVLVALSVIVIVVIANYDWNRHKPWLTQTLSKALDRKVVIDGDLAVHWERDPALRGIKSWLPGPRVTADKVSIGNPSWSKSPQFATVSRVEMDVSVLPLLAHVVSIPAMKFDDPDLHIERESEKRNNWTFGTDEDTGKGSPWKFDFGRVEFAKGKISVLDRVKDLDVKINVDHLRETIPFSELVAKQEAASQKEAAEKVGTSAAKQINDATKNTPEPGAASNKPSDKKKDNDDDEDEPDAGKNPDGSKKALPTSPETAKVSNEPMHYAFVWTATGTFHGKPVKGEGRTGGVFALKHAERPFPLQGDVRFGDTRIAFVGTLTDPTSPDALDLRLWLSGQSLAQLYDLLGVTLPESPPYATEGRLVGQLVPNKEKVRYEHFTARVGESDLDGDLTYQNKQPRPLLSGTVNSKQLQFRDLAPLIGAKPPADDDHPEPPPPADKVLPEEPFKPERWKVMDADVRFTGDRVFRDYELPIHKMDTRIRMDNAVLTLDPLKFRFAYGDVDGAIKMDGSGVPVKGSIKATAKEVQLKRLIKLSDPSQFDIGNANATVDLTSSGNSVGSLLGAANGEVKALIGGGHISKVLMEEAALNVPNILIAKIVGDKQIQINCAAANFEANSGTYYSRLFLIDTDAAQINIDGSVDLASEKLDLTIHPDTKGLRLFSLRSPIHVKGTFKKPDVGIDKGVLFARGAGAVGLAVLAAPAAALLPLTSGLGKGDEDRCTPLLDSMKKPPSVTPPKTDASDAKRK